MRSPTSLSKLHTAGLILFRLTAIVLLALFLTASLGDAAEPATRTPVKHIIVLFQENVSFDHYFATYPAALNPPGEPVFNAAPGTPSVNGLTPALIALNPNRAKPYRLGPKDAATCDMDHDYKAEQQAFDGGLMDKFVEFTSPETNRGKPCDRKAVMGYFDGNTVTALWTYAQAFAMSDNSYGTVFGPSTPGAIDLIAGDTHGAIPANLGEGDEAATVQGTVIGDPDPKFDDCSSPKSGLIAMTGRHIGDLLDAKGVTWGWFQGGFKPTATEGGKAVCGASSVNITGAKVGDYSPHHEPFQYYERSANPHHLPPSAPDRIGETDQAKHQYDLADFYAALDTGRLPAVSFVKAKKAGDGHAGFTYSNPLDEQAYLVQIVNAIGKSPYWKDTAIVIAYDDSDGWYDHVMPPVLHGSAIPGLDALNGPGTCGPAPAQGADPARCGYGPRLPLLILSPYAKRNYVDHTLTDQTSILRFIEDNWRLGRIGGQSRDTEAGSLEGMFDWKAHSRPLVLDSKTGAVIR